MQPAISLRGVVKTFGSGMAEVQALRGINLEVPAGELFMLIGPSGCGKTTLISIVAGILRQDAGAVRLLDVDLASLDERGQADFRLRHVGFVFQQFNLVPTLSVQENVAIPLLIAGQSRQAAYARADEVLHQVGLEGLHSASPGILSGGQQQRVAIARALANDPAILVCDEPTSALDHEKGKQVMELLRAIAVRPGRVLVVVSHDNRIYNFSDRIASMQDGHIIRVIRRRFDATTPASSAVPAGITCDPLAPVPSAG